MIQNIRPTQVNSYMRHWTGSSLVHVMACCLFGAKPLPEPMMAYCQFDSWKQISVNFISELRHFLWQICTWECRLQKQRPSCSGLNILTRSVSLWQETPSGSQPSAAELGCFLEWVAINGDSMALCHPDWHIVLSLCITKLLSSFSLHFVLVCFLPTGSIGLHRYSKCVQSDQQSWAFWWRLHGNTKSYVILLCRDV